MNMADLRFRAAGARRPVIGVLCCNEVVDRPVQVVASRFIEPLSRIAGATVLLVPALADVSDAVALTDRLDGLLLTGSRSNVGAHHYGGDAEGDGGVDPQRDLVALALAEHMIEAGRPVFGICRGLQELNVLFGGTLTRALPGDAHHRPGDGIAFADLFDHRHDVTLSENGVLRALGEGDRISVNSVHRQGIDRLGAGLRIEAVSPGDGLIEAFSARPCGAEVLAVQWHPEWNGAEGATNRGFFQRIGAALRGMPSLAFEDFR
jgi:putative glutamine amidotransferase